MNLSKLTKGELMKKLVLVAASLLVTQTSSAFIIDQRDDVGCNSKYANAFSCTLMTTFSLPTVIVAGQELDLNSVEADARLQAELDGAAQPVLLTTIANDAGMSVQEVAAVALGMQQLTVRGLVATVVKR